jgi:hypothetical protein
MKLITIGRTTGVQTFVWLNQLLALTGTGAERNQYLC